MKHTDKSKRLEINLVGRLQDDIGLGAAAGRTLAALKGAGIDIHEASLGDLRLIHRINLLYTGLSSASRLTSAQTRYLRTGRFTIAQYYWELPKFPDIYRPALALADELWAASHFTQSALAGMASVPVHLVPPPVVVSTSPDVQRANFGLPDHRTIYLFSFNATSHYERKNPEAVVQAFQRAFGDGGSDGPLLVIKSQYLERYPALYRRLSALVEQTGGVFINDVLTRQQMTDLLTCADIYASLHRAEGFGLGMAEVMYLGKPVIGTNYSGNTDFMTPENSFPVDFKLRPIVQGDHFYQPDFEAVYEAGQLWAEPDIDQAAGFMARLYEHPELRERTGAQAARDIAALYAPEVIAQTMLSHLTKIDLSLLPTPLSAVESKWKHWGQRIYRTAVPTPLRLAFRRMRRPGERRVPVLEPQTIRYQAAEELARLNENHAIIVLGIDSPDEIAAIGQRFDVTAVGDAESLKRVAQLAGVTPKVWTDPIPRSLLQGSIVLANLGSSDAAKSIEIVKDAVDLGALCIVTQPIGAPETMDAFEASLAAHALPVEMCGYADGRFAALVGDLLTLDAAPPADYRVVAVMPAFNEADIILHALRHLIAQGVEVYVLDNHSTDGTGDLARTLLGKGVIAVETYPPENSGALEWHALLQRVEALSETLDANWIMFHDADELRESFDPRLSLREALYQVDRAGYNAVNHAVLNFAPTDDEYTPDKDPKDHFRYREPLTQRDYSVQIKIWKRGPVNLTGSGGHSAVIADRRVYPFRFLMRHYPIRGQQHGERKIFRERQPRVKTEERARGWYSHVEDYTPRQSFIRDPAALSLVDESFYENFLLQRLTGVGLFRPDPDRPKTVFITDSKRRLPKS